MNTIVISDPFLNGRLDGRKAGAPSSRPRAVLAVQANAMASVCAWCVDKVEADVWCRARGYDTTHTICPSCRVRFMGEYAMLSPQLVA